MFVFECLVHSKTNPAGDQELGLWPVLLFDDDNPMLWHLKPWASLCGPHPRRRGSDPECTFQVFSYKKILTLNWHNVVNVLSIDIIRSNSCPQSWLIPQNSDSETVVLFAKMPYLASYPDWSKKAMKICLKLSACPAKKDSTCWSRCLKSGNAPKIWWSASASNYEAENSSIISWLSNLRFLNDQLTTHFRAKGLFFQATYVTSVRDWSSNMEHYSTTFGAYRKRKKDDKVVPHSFTFVRRDCSLFGFSLTGLTFETKNFFLDFRIIFSWLKWSFLIVNMFIFLLYHHVSSTGQSAQACRCI